MKSYPASYVALRHLTIPPRRSATKARGGPADIRAPTNDIALMQRTRGCAACWQHRSVACNVLIFPATLCLGGVLFSWLEHQGYEEQEARRLQVHQHAV